MKTTIKLLGFSAALAVLVAAGDASAAGLVMNASDLPAKARTDLAQEIARAKTDVPELVRDVREVAAHARELDQGSRLPGAPLTMPFKALGPRAFGPMIELLAFDAPAQRDLPATAGAALRLGLIEAVGIIRDARAIPVFALLLERSSDFDTMRASAEASRGSERTTPSPSCPRRRRSPAAPSGSARSSRGCTTAGARGGGEAPRRASRRDGHRRRHRAHRGEVARRRGQRMGLEDPALADRAGRDARDVRARSSARTSASARATCARPRRRRCSSSTIRAPGPS